MGVARRVFVDLGDVHGPLGVDENDAATSGDWLVDDLNRRFLLAGNPQGLLYHYATLAAAIADTAALTTGQYVMINGGDQGATGVANADRGVWLVAANQGAAFADYTKVLDGHNVATEIDIIDTNGWYSGTTVEAALDEIGTKQVFFKLGHGSLYNKTVSGATSTAFDAALKALVIDNGTGVDVAGAGTSSVSGIIQTSAYAYQIPIRDASTRDIIEDGSNNEVYARLSFTGGNYVVSFFSYKAGVETAYTFASAKAIDLGYVLVSQDFMKLPAHAGVVQGEFFGDQAGSVGTITDNMVVTNAPAFTGLLVGQATQEAVNLKLDELGLAGAGQGASLIAIEDAGGYLTATNVEAALAELAVLASNRVKNYVSVAAAIAAAPHAVGTYIIVDGSVSADERGIYVINGGTGSLLANYTKVLDISHTASEVLLSNATGWFTAGDVQAAIEALTQSMGGGANAFTRNYSSNSFVTDGDDLITAIGKLDAAIGAINTKALSSVTDFVAGEALNAATNGPRLASQGGSDGSLFLSKVDGIGAQRVKIVGFATGADYATNTPIAQGQGVVMSGICGGFTGLTVGSVYYADPTTMGNITTTVPNVVGQWVVPVGIAISATTLLVRVGEPTQIVAAAKVAEYNAWFRSCAGIVGGVGETGFVINPGDSWTDNDASFQNPTKQGLGRYTEYKCKQTWTGTGSAITAAQLSAYFVPVGKQG